MATGTVAASNDQGSRQFPSSTDATNKQAAPGAMTARGDAVQAAGSMTLLAPSRPGTDTLGFTGLKQIRGILYEEDWNELRGSRGVATFKKMGRDPVASACLYVIRNKLKRIKWEYQQSINPKSNDAKAKAALDYINSCHTDMERPWSSVLNDMCSAFQYGWAYLEETFKYRKGTQTDPRLSSPYSDGRLGWRRISLRSQDTLYRWEYTDPDDPERPNELVGLHQISPPTFKPNFIPLWKAVHFTLDSEKENPEGRSILLGAYEAWYYKKTLQNVEAVGIERDLNGLPVAWVPPELLDPNAPEAMQAQLAAIKQLVVNVKRDDQEGVIFPLAYDEHGHKIYDFGLVNSQGHRQFDTSAVVDRHNRDMAMSMLADFIFLGHENTGSYALSDAKTDSFAEALAAHASSICDVWNQQAVNQLCDWADIDPVDRPFLNHGNVERANLEEMAEFILKIAQAGAPLFPNPDLEDFLLDNAGLPVPTPEFRKQQEEEANQVANLQSQLIAARTELDQSKRQAVGPSQEQAATSAGNAAAVAKTATGQATVAQPAAPNPTGRNQNSPAVNKQPPKNGSPATNTRRPASKAGAQTSRKPTLRSKQ